MKRKRVFIYVVLILTGALAGYAYWYYIGCTSGTCPLTSSWKSSTLLGALVGYFFSDTILTKKNKAVASKEIISK